MTAPEPIGTGGDDAPAVQAWLNSLIGGGTARLSRVYRLRSPIQLQPGTSIVGDGPGVSGFAFEAGAPDVTMITMWGGCGFTDLSIDAGNMPTGGADLLAAANGTNHFVKVHFLNDQRIADVGWMMGLFIGLSGPDNSMLDCRFERVIRSIWDGGARTMHTRSVFRHTGATPFTLAGSGIKIFDADAIDIGENVVMTDVGCVGNTISGFMVDGVRRKADNGTCFEIHGSGWTIEDIDVVNVDWSIFTCFDPVNLRMRRLFLSNPGQCSDGVLEPGPDNSACITLYARNRGFGRPAPTNIRINDFTLTDDSGRNHAIKFLGQPDSELFSDVYIGAGTMPGKWFNNQPVIVRKAETDGVVRSVCGARCFNGNAQL